MFDAGVCSVLDGDAPGFWLPSGENVNSVIDKEQDYYGLLVQFFPNGVPLQSEIENGMMWNMERWLNGNKPIYPGWMF